MGKIVAVYSTKEKGARKEPVAEGILKKGYGLAGDAHTARNTHRQVSLLTIESVNKMQRMGFEVNPGDFCENLTTQHIELISLPVGTLVSIGKEAIIEICQIGKDCDIPRYGGKCIMSKEGVFARVICDGRVKAGDEIKLYTGGSKA